MLGLAAYAPAFEGPFVWDDELLVLRKEVAELKSIGVYLARPFWLSADWEGGAAYYRPLTILSLALDNALHAGNAAGFHLTNLLLHGANALLVFLLARRLGATGLPALLSALLFAWFPRLSEAAGWISGRTDLLAALFSLAALLVTLGNGRLRAWRAASLAFLGLLSKEVAVATVVAIVGYEWFRDRSRPVKERLTSTAPQALAALIYVGLRARVLGPGLDPGDIGPQARILSALESVGRYGFMIVDGWHPQLNIGAVGQPDFRFVALGAGIGLISTPLARRARFRNGECLLLVAASVSIGLVLHILPFHSTIVVADRFLYLPVALLAAVAGGRLAAVQPRRVRHGLLVATAALTLSYLPFTWRRAQVWGDEIAFWGTAVREQASQHNALSHLGLGALLARHGMWNEAMAILNRARAGDGRNFLLARQQQAQLLGMNGETERALGVLEDLARLHPLPTFYSSIALLHAVAGRHEQARDATAEFSRLVNDQERADDLAKSVLGLRAARPRTLAPDASFDERMSHAQGLAQAMLFRVAMSELAALAADPLMTSEKLRPILVFALSYGTPQQVTAIHERLLQIDPATPGEFSLLVAERTQRVARLRRLCRELGVEVRS